jgi:hypothetical protein
MRYRRQRPSSTSVFPNVSSPLIVGQPLGGDLSEWLIPTKTGTLFGYPERALGMHLVAVGGSGAGKTETLLALGARAAKAYGWKTFFLDCKGDPATQLRFAAAMHHAGARRIGIFPQSSYDGWRGDSPALLNRMLAVQDFTNPYFQSVAKLMLDLTFKKPNGMPRSSSDFLGALRLESLQRCYRGRPEADDVDGIDKNAGQTSHGRYRSFFAALNGKLDGTWAFEDVDAAYLLLEGTALKDEAGSLGRYFLEDFSHYVTKRKPQNERVLLIVDEYSAISDGADGANLFERVRSFGASLAVSSQSFSGLGNRKEAERILDAAHTLIVHRCADPERLVQRAGTYKRPERSTYVDRAGPTGQGSVRIQDTFKVPPDSARQLGTGEVYVIAAGRAHKVGVTPVEPQEVSIEAAKKLVVQDSETRVVDQPKVVNAEPQLEFA